MKLARYLTQDLLKLALKRNKMAFVSGPRQVGKTTLAKSLQPQFDHSSYLNWDESAFRKLWLKNPNQVADLFDLTLARQSRLLILDEIHKSKKWKQKLKGIYDHFGENLNLIVTGSARLDIFQKGGDSLMGRYINFRLHPLSLGEALKREPLPPEAWKASLFKKQDFSHQKLQQNTLEKLYKFSGFPEPFFEADEKIHRIWQKSRNDKIIREDLRDLSRLPELSQIEMLVSLLPSKVGSPLSVQSLREDLEVAHDTVSRWLNYLGQLYYFFSIRPWNKSIARSIKKEPKIYLYDWTEIETPGERFENLVASHLLKACQYWTDTGEGVFDLFYLRNKEKQEIDFLIVKDKTPWLAIESKYADSNIDFKKTNKLIDPLKCPCIQVIFEAGHDWKSKTTPTLGVMSAHLLLSGLP